MKHFYRYAIAVIVMLMLEAGYAVPRIEFTLAIKNDHSEVESISDLKVVMESGDLTEPQVLEIFENVAFDKNYRRFRRRFLEIAADHADRETAVAAVSSLIQGVLLSERKDFSLTQISAALGVDLEQVSDEKTQVFQEAFDRLITEDALRYVEDSSTPELEKYRRKTLIIGLKGSYGGALKLQNSILQNKLRMYGIFEFRWRNNEGEVLEEDVNDISNFDQRVNFELELFEHKMAQALTVISQLDFLK